MQVSNDTFAYDTFDNIPVRDSSTYLYDDMMAYVSLAAFLCMATIFVMILSL